MARSGLVLVLEHEDTGVLCRAWRDVFRLLEERGIEVRVNGVMERDACWEQG